MQNGGNICARVVGLNVSKDMMERQQDLGTVVVPQVSEHSFILWTTFLSCSSHMFTYYVIAQPVCRTCAVSVLRGGELLSKPKVNEKKIIEETAINRMRLSCKSFVGMGMKEGEIAILVNPRQW